MNATDRLLVHGPGLRDLSEFLYFDKVVYPVLTALLRPNNLAPGYAGYPVQEFIPEEVRNALVEAGLLVTPATILLVPPADALPSMLGEGVEEITKWQQQKSAEIAANLFLISSLDEPLTGANVRKWLTDIDMKTMKVGEIVKDSGKQAVAKLYNDSLSTVLTPGWDKVLSLTLRLPRLAPNGAPIETIIDFLTDSETVKKRAHLFRWYEEMSEDMAPESGLIDHITELLVPRLKTFLQWLQKSGLVSGFREAEFLVHLARPLDPNNNVKSENEFFHLAERGLTLPGAAELPAQEVAYITHTKRHWKEWFPGVLQ